MSSDAGQKILSYSAGDLILREGELAPGLLLVKSGRVQVFRKENQSEVILGVATAGQFLGEVSLLLDSPVSASARAMDDVKIVLFDRGLCSSQLQGAPQWLVSLAKGLASRLDLMNRKMTVEAPGNIGVATPAIASNPQDPGWEG